MRHNFLALCCFSLAVIACSEKREMILTPGAETGPEIIIDCGDGFNVDVDTKASATEITSLSGKSLKFMATNATGSASAVSSTAATVSSSNKITTGIYQSVPATSYIWYLANSTGALSFSSSKVTTSAANTVDFIYGKSSASSSAAPAITMNHAFARTATLTLNAETGYSISGTPTWKITSVGANTGTAGTFDLTNNTWSSTTALTQTTFNSSSDLYLIPGEYRIDVTYTITKGSTYSETFTKSGTVTLVAGKKNSITATGTGNASEIVLSVSLSAWGTQNLDLSLE